MTEMSALIFLCTGAETGAPSPPIPVKSSWIKKVFIMVSAYYQQGGPCVTAVKNLRLQKYAIVLKHTMWYL